MVGPVPLKSQGVLLRPCEREPPRFRRRVPAETVDLPLPPSPVQAAEIAQRGETAGTARAGTGEMTGPDPIEAVKTEFTGHTYMSFKVDHPVGLWFFRESVVNLLGCVWRRRSYPVRVRARILVSLLWWLMHSVAPVFGPSHTHTPKGG